MMPHGKFCEANGPCGCCSQKLKSARPASMKNLGKALTLVCSKHCATCDGRLPTNATCRPMCYSVTLRYATWRAYVLARQVLCSACGVWASGNLQILVSGLLTRASIHV